MFIRKAEQHRGGRERKTGAGRDLPGPGSLTPTPTTLAWGQAEAQSHKPHLASLPGPWVLPCLLSQAQLEGSCPGGQVARCRENALVRDANIQGKACLSVPVTDPTR